MMEELANTTADRGGRRLFLPEARIESSLTGPLEIMERSLLRAGKREPRLPDRAVEPCIVCRSRRVEPFLDLGETALANKFLSEAELGRPEPTYPLEVGFCHGCNHVQLTEHVPPSAMFADYLYVSSASETLTRHLRDLSDVVVGRYALVKGDLVIDVGCNDGTLLRGFRRHGVRSLGVDPARNLAELYPDPEIDRYTGFFDSRSAVEIRDRYGRAAAVTATNTFPHIPAIRDFVAGLDTVLAPGGVFVIEAHYLGDLLDQAAFDTVYHEHVSYWALGPMTRLFEDAGMRVVDVQRLPVHHGQLRAFVQRMEEGEVRPGVEMLLADERERGLDRIETYRAFAERSRRLKEDLRAKLTGLRAEGNRVVGYGAPAKGNTLLGFLELGPADLEYIVDRSPLKVGLYTPGTHIPVVAPERLVADQPEYVVLLAWNFADEIIEQQAEYRRRGGRFIVPVPDVRIVD
jgi:SAM-dependent methyltransferase